MPLWNVYHPAGAYTVEEKREFADRVTGLYAARGLPRFYVGVLFHEVDRGSFYVGGEPTGDVVRVAIDHIARHIADPAGREESRRLINQRADPVVRGRQGPALGIPRR